MVCFTKIHSQCYLFQYPTTDMHNFTSTCQIQSVKLSEKWKAKGKAEKKEEADKWALKRSSSIEELIN